MAKRELILWADSIQADIDRILREGEARAKRPPLTITDENKEEYIKATSPKERATKRFKPVFE